MFVFLNGRLSIMASYILSFGRVISSSTGELCSLHYIVATDINNMKKTLKFPLRIKFPLSEEFGRTLTFLEDILKFVTGA